MVLAQLPDHLPNLHHLLGVQTHGGLVQDDELRKTQNGLGQTHPLAVALGQIADNPARLLLQMS